MKKVKGYNDFTNDRILESVSVGKYQRSIQKFYKESGIKLHNAYTYTTSLTVLIQYVQKLMEHSNYEAEPTIENAIMLTMFGVSILSSEAKDKTESLYNYLKERGINDGDMDNVLNQLKNTKKIFTIISKNAEKEIKSFEDMLKYTSMLVPFITIMKNLLDKELLNADYISVEWNEYRKLITVIEFKLFIMRILHRFNIITRSTNKFQNKDNAKPLKVNDELKSPLLQSEDTILEESHRDKQNKNNPE